MRIGIGSLFGPALLGLGLLGHSAAAQTPTPAPTPTPPAIASPAPMDSAASAARVTEFCNKVVFDRPRTAEEVALAKSCLEAIKLQQEIEKASRPPDIATLLIGMGGMIAAFLALMSAGIGYLAKTNSERRYIKLQETHAKADHERTAAQERALRRETRTLTLLDTLAGDTPPKRSYAATGLISIMQANKEDNRQETDMIVAALLARVRDPALTPGEQKYIGDEIAKFFNARAASYKLSDFNLQQVRLPKAYLAKINAANVDFFESDLSGASFRGATLHNAVFLNAELRGVQFAEANLGGADLRGARLQGALLANASGLEAAKFDASTIADASTTWPRGFDPAARGITIKAG